MLPVEFWFDLASPYSMIAALRIDDQAKRYGLEVKWVPFLLGPIFTEQLGIKDSPFNLNPARRRYMFRDLERLCAKYGFEWSPPREFPRYSVYANRLAIVALTEMDPRTGHALVRQLFRCSFGDNSDIGDPHIIGHIASVFGTEEEMAVRVRRIEDQDIKDKLRANTAEASRRGIFGAPTFFVGEEMFFGQDRLDDALEWARTAPYFDLPPGNA
jgi:2-hydroxychromene-2-carboxylate isomerase